MRIFARWFGTKEAAGATNPAVANESVSVLFVCHGSTRR